MSRLYRIFQSLHAEHARLESMVAWLQGFLRRYLSHMSVADLQHLTEIGQYMAGPLQDRLQREAKALHPVYRITLGVDGEAMARLDEEHRLLAALAWRFARAVQEKRFTDMEEIVPQLAAVQHAHAQLEGECLHLLAGQDLPPADVVRLTTTLLPAYTAA